MAIPWLAVLKSVPWSTVVSNAPVVADGAKKLWNAVAGKAPAPAATEAPPVQSEGQSAEARAIAALRARVAALEADAKDMHGQMLASSDLIKSLAEQNTQLIARLDLQRRVMRWFAVALIAAVALFALLAAQPAAADGTVLERALPGR